MKKNRGFAGKEVLNTSGDEELRRLGREMLDELKHIGGKLRANHGIHTNLESGDSNLEALKGMFVFPQGANPQMGQSGQNGNLQLFEFPIHVRENNSNAYEPKKVSIGPYHYGKDHLIPMQEHKKRALIHFLHRYNVPLESYIGRLMAVVDDLRRTYKLLDRMTAWQDKDDFVSLMMIDGVFLLEFLSVARGRQINHEEYDENDPIFGHYGFIISHDALMDDLLLLENQLPYLVLYTLCDVSAGVLVRGGGESDADYVLRQEERKGMIMNTLYCLLFSENIDNQGSPFLDSYLRQLLTQGRREPSETETKIPVSLLIKYGIQLEAVDSYTEMGLEESRGTLKHAVSFWSTKKRRLKLLPIIFDERKIRAYLNLKVYETGRQRQEWNSYIHLMDTLVQSIEDINLLESQGIIVNSLNSYKDVRGVMKELKKDTKLDSDSNACFVLREVKKFYEQKTNSKRTQVLAKLATLEGIAAFILLLTIVQAFYAVLPYHKSSDDKPKELMIKGK